MDRIPFYDPNLHHPRDIGRLLTALPEDAVLYCSQDRHFIEQPIEAGFVTREWQARHGGDLPMIPLGSPLIGSELAPNKYAAQELEIIFRLEGGSIRNEQIQGDPWGYQPNAVDGLASFLGRLNFEGNSLRQQLADARMDVDATRAEVAVARAELDESRRELREARAVRDQNLVELCWARETLATIRDILARQSQPVPQ